MISFIKHSLLITRDIQNATYNEKSAFSPLNSKYKLHYIQVQRELIVSWQLDKHLVISRQVKSTHVEASVIKAAHSLYITQASSHCFTLQ